MIGSDLSDHKYLDCTVRNSVISGCAIDRAVLSVHFEQCKIEGLNFFTVKTSLLAVSFERCVIRHCSFAGLKLHNTRFTHCELINVDFADADLTSADFQSSRFVESTFNNTTLTKANFREAIGYMIDPQRNKVRGARFDLPEVLSLLLPFGIRIGE